MQGCPGKIRCHVFGFLFSATLCLVYLRGGPPVPSRLHCACLFLDSEPEAVPQPGHCPGNDLALGFRRPNVIMLRPDGAGICLFLSSSATGKTFATLGRRKVKAGGGRKQIYGFGDKCMGKILGNFFHCPGRSLAPTGRGKQWRYFISVYLPLSGRSSGPGGQGAKRRSKGPE